MGGGRDDLVRHDGHMAVLRTSTRCAVVSRLVEEHMG
jgi:hypothetical protein